MKNEPLDQDSRNRLALDHLIWHFKFDPTSFSNLELLDFSNVWMEYIYTLRAKP